jgi:enoyl-CoA hydratase
VQGQRNPASSGHADRFTIRHGRRADARRACGGDTQERGMETLSTMVYERRDRVAHIILNRPDRGNCIIPETPLELMACVERANLDPQVHVIALSGNGKGFCGGYDLIASAERMGSKEWKEKAKDTEGSPLDLRVIAMNHAPGQVWDSMTDYAMMSRNVRGFMSLFFSDKPVVCKVHGFCVAGGTDMALCSDLMVVEDQAKIGYPPARVWGTPTTAMWAFRLGAEKAKRLLFTGDCLSGSEAVAWGLATESAPAANLDERFEVLLQRIAKVPVNQLIMHKLMVNQTLLAQGLMNTQILGTVFDGIARHTREGYAFQMRAAQAGFKQAVRERDDPFGDFGPSTFKG